MSPGDAAAPGVRGTEGGRQIEAGGPTTSVQHDRARRPPDARTRSWFLAGYDTGQAAGWTFGSIDGWRHGYAAAWSEGRAALAEELTEARSVSIEAHDRALVQALTSTPPFDVLADRRGQHERAERQRETLAERGIA